MVTIDARLPRARAVRPRFYLVMSLLMAATIVAGFAKTVPGDFTDTPALPLLLHLHGAVFTLWVLLFVAQPSFIARGSIKLHRQIGMLGAVLAGAMVVMGLTATFLAIHMHMVPSFFPKGVFLVMNALGILVFGGMVAAGIVLRHKSEWHKRLMLTATVSILGPGLGRFLPMGSFGPAAPLVMYGVILSFALAGPIADLIARRRVHPAYFWGVGAILLTDIAIPILAFAPPTTALVKWIASS